MRESVFLLALAIAASTVVFVARAIAGAIGGRRGGRDAAQLREQLDQYAVALEDAQTTLAQQATQLAELQERVDFTERLLAQGRDRTALPPGEQRG